MTDTASNPQIELLLNNAAGATSPASLVQRAADLTAPGHHWKGRTKLTEEEAIAAMRVVTTMVHRFGLQPTTTLVKAGRASAPSATYKLYLTPKEMAAGAAITRKRKDLNLSVRAHVDSIRQIALHARAAGHEVDTDELLGGLAAAMPDFLEQFREELDIDPDAELASDIERIAPWLASPHRGIEVVRFMTESFRQEVIYNEQTGLMEYQGSDGDWDDANTPFIPLLTRVVARAAADVLIEAPDQHEEEKPRGRIRLSGPELRPIGKAHCFIAYKVGLGAALTQERRGLRMVFTLDPVSYVGQPIGGEDDPHWMTRGYSKLMSVRGIPIPGRPQRVGDEGQWFSVHWPLDYKCTEFEEFVDQVYDDERGWDEAALWTRRWLPVTAQTCARVFEDQGHLFRMIRSFSGLEEDSVLPEVAVSEGGVESWAPRDRFESLLYAKDEPSAAGLLLEQAERRMRAFEEFMIRSASGIRQRKLAFRSRMRR
ncbi:hypothetical protein [Microvirga sp. VF16]|uniref:hypothetical protein n=1 Tax=Microvirga sp. VF16 TaxID=2807101 RepID=UPI00193D1CB4|nr:hypothetical protein [Microvirga sp. VF16]QRM36042.1 hypothetical protein JO965_45525 [Microvirga sp. VF16]